MATATPVKRVVETVDGMTLTLNADETRTLWAILMNVGGSPLTSPRKHASTILEAMAEPTGRGKYGGPGDREPEIDLVTGSIVFADYR